MEGEEEYTLSEDISLEELLESSVAEFPIVVQTCGSAESNTGPLDSETSLPAEKVVMLERTAVVEFAHLRVMPLESEREAEERNGPEFTLEYNGFVGEEMLIPLIYPATVNMTHPPGKRRRYSEISQIIEDLPCYIRFDIDTVPKSPPGVLGEGAVKRGTVLEVTNVVTSPCGKLQYLQCTSENKSKYVFRHDQMVNCTAIYDDRTYTLPDVLTSFLLPKIVKFENKPKIEDIAACSNLGINNTLVMTYGPMEFLGSKTKRFAIGWIREDVRNLYRPKKLQHFKVVLIPDTRWPTDIVRVCRFNMNDGKKLYVEKMFPSCGDSQFVEKKLYIMQQNETMVTWLNSDTIMEDEKRVQITEEDKDAAGYWFPGPPIPPRSPIHTDTPTTAEQPKVHHDVLVKVAQKMRLGFGQVHRQLSILFSHKGKPKPSVKRLKSKERPLPDIPKGEVDPDHQDEDHSRVYDKLTDTIETRPYSVISEKQITPETEYETFSELTKSDRMVILKENQTVEDFCKYSVRQVSECFRLCALGDFGKKCEMHKVDGVFLAGYDLQELKNEPFCLTEFSLKKVKLIINNGWRPSHQS